MSGFQAIAGWLEIEALGEFTASVMMRDYDRVAPLSMPDGGRGSIDTRNTQCDTHLRSADIFDSGNHPHVTFTADYIRPSGGPA